MALTARTKRLLREALADLGAGDDLIAAVNAGAGLSPQTAVTINTVTATSGTLPTPSGSTTIADTTTPTVVELLDLCMEIRAKLIAVNAVLASAGVTA